MHHYICELYGNPESEQPNKIIKHFKCDNYDQAIEEFVTALDNMGKLHCLQVRYGMPFVQVYDPIDIEKVDFVYGVVSARELLKWQNTPSVEVIDATKT